MRFCCFEYRVTHWHNFSIRVRVLRSHISFSLARLYGSVDFVAGFHAASGSSSSRLECSAAYWCVALCWHSVFMILFSCAKLIEFTFAYTIVLPHGVSFLACIFSTVLCSAADAELAWFNIRVIVICDTIFEYGGYSASGFAVSIGGSPLWTTTGISDLIDACDAVCICEEGSNCVKVCPCVHVCEFSIDLKWFCVLLCYLC